MAERIGARNGIGGAVLREIMRLDRNFWARRVWVDFRNPSCYASELWFKLAAPARGPPCPGDLDARAAGELASGDGGSTRHPWLRHAPAPRPNPRHRLLRPPYRCLAPLSQTPLQRWPHPADPAAPRQPARGRAGGAAAGPCPPLVHGRHPQRRARQLHHRGGALHWPARTLPPACAPACPACW
eukprot:COSAG04_NODE_60_length_30221_cov_15.908837_11_plen_184_part_00